MKYILPLVLASTMLVGVSAHAADVDPVQVQEAHILGSKAVMLLVQM